LLSTIRPGDEQELSLAIQDACNSNVPLEVFGAGTKRAIGRPMNTTASITTTRFRGISLYEPNELVMTAGAGTPLSTIEHQLDLNNQQLAFEPIDPASVIGGENGQMTIGGIFATNLSGSRRIQVGAARDHLLGIRGVNGRGEIFKSGGRVMKNVTGYDLCRGLSGSWGTLAVLTEVSFKVLPRAEESRTLLFFGMPDEIATEVMSRAVQTPYEVSGTLHLQKPFAEQLRHEALRNMGQAITAIRLENFSSFVDARAEKLRAAFADYGEVHQLDDENSRLFWREIRELSFLQDGTDPLWRISTAPKDGPRFMTALSGFMDCRTAYDWAGGLIWVEVPATTDAGAAEIRRLLASIGGHATLIRAEPSVRATINVFQPLEPGLAKLSSKLKAQYDPVGILNPGRLYASI